MSYAVEEVIGSLLVGGSLLFGKRVELSWPDGAPDGMTEEMLVSIGEEWLSKGKVYPSRWVRADAEFCHKMVPCGQELRDGKCERHDRER